MNARTTALSALIAMRRQNAWADGALKDYTARDRLDRRDAALAARLLYGVVQNRMLLDFYLAQAVAAPLTKLQPVVLDILRLGAYQILFLDKIPVSAAVNEAVEQTKTYANKRAAGLVNGSLRTLARRKDELEKPHDLATKYSHPQPLVDCLRASMDEETLEAFLAADNDIPKTALQANPLKASAEQVAAALLDPRVIDLEHRLIDAQGEVGLGLGSEPNQICAVAHPNRIDHYVTEMLRPEAYGRYMDDFYLIHESKEYLQVCLLLIGRKCAELGIELNPRKTRVVKLSRGFTWLKKRIFYTETGRIVVKPCRDSITRERRKLKKMARMVADGVMTPEQVEQSYQSWRGGMKRLDAHRSVRAMDALYRSLFGNPAGGGCSMQSKPGGDTDGNMPLP